MSERLFGTDGIRGLPGAPPLDDRTLRAVGRALGERLRDVSPASSQPRFGDTRPRVLIGMDTRESGPHIARQLAAGLAAAGAQPVSAGIITTPGVACLVRDTAFAAGIVVSASHNPYTDNGVKLLSHAGMKFPDEFEESLERRIAEAAESRGDGEFPLEPDPQFEERYLEFLRGRLPAGANLRGMRIVLDCANGAASHIGPALFRSLGCDVVAVHDRPDGRNINAACGSLHPESMQKKVIESGAALGVAFDGDADRAIFATASGKLVDGDGVLLVAARWLRAHGQLKGDAIIGTTMANLGLERAFGAEGLRLVRVPVGDRYVLEEMLRSGANLGGEQSGHVIFLDDAPTGDGLLTALKMASIVTLLGPLEDLVRDLRIFPQTIVNVRVRSKPPLDSLAAVAQVLAEAERALGNRGRIVLRYSGTEPLARVMVEAERAEDVARWSEALASAIRSSLGQ